MKVTSMKRTSPDKLLLAKYYRSGGMSVRKISMKTGLKKSTIHENLAQKLPLTSANTTGRPKILSPKLKSLLVRHFESGRFMTSTEAKKYLTNNHDVIVSNQTIRNELRSAGLKSYARPLKPRLKKIHRLQRLNFAKAMKNVEEGFWETVIFTDESKYNIYAPDGHLRVWRRPGIPTLNHHVRETVKFGGGNVMVWGAITYKGVGKLVFIEGKMNSVLFFDVLKEGFCETLRMNGMSSEEVYLQQDNDPKHVSKYTKNELDKAGIDVLPWASCSPDMNPIEHVWNDVDFRLRKRSIQPTNKHELMKAIEEKWMNTSPEYIKSLYNSMPTRINALYQAKGGFTKY